MSAAADRRRVGPRVRWPAAPVLRHEAQLRVAPLARRLLEGVGQVELPVLRTLAQVLELTVHLLVGEDLVEVRVRLEG